MPRIQITNRSTPSVYGAFLGNATDTYKPQNASFPANGWINELGFYIAGAGGTISARFAIYNGSSRIYLGPTKSIGTAQQLRTENVGAIKASEGDNIYIGFGWNGNVEIGVNGDNNAKAAGERYGNIYPPPTTLSSTTTDDTPMVGYLDYIANATPLTGTWRFGATPAGSISTVTPTFEGNMLHPSADSAYDSTSSVQLRIVNATDPSIVYYDSTFAPTATEKSQGWFSRAPVTLPGNTSCMATFRHADSFGVWSPDSAATIFTTAAGPSKATALSPNAKINVISGYNYVSTPQHTSGTNLDRFQMRLHNAAGAVIYTSQELTITSTPPGTAVTVGEASLTSHPDLAWATQYQWSVRYRDTAGIWGEYTDPQSFRTNSAPAPPTSLDPSGDVTRGNRAFSASATDPDGDAITSAQIEIRVAATDALVTGYPAAMTVSGGNLSFTAAASGSTSLVLGTRYKWRVNASDGNPNSPGAWSDYSFFTYNTVGTVTMLGPLISRQNIVLQPSAEYDPANLSAFWTETARAEGTNFIDRVQDFNAFDGATLWRATTPASGDNRLQSAFIDVDGTKSYSFYVRARKVSGTSAAHFNVLCYNSSNTLVGTLYPGTSETGATPANALNLTTAWQRLGGIVYSIGSAGSPAFPAGTTKVRIEFTPSRNSAAVVDFDAFSSASFPLPPLTTTYQKMRDWLGYADGDTPEIGLTHDYYSWTGAAGDSASDVAPILTNTAGAASPANFVFDYSHPSGTAKTDDKVDIEQWDDEEGLWIRVYTGVYSTAGARELIPVPLGVLANDSRYRVRIWAKDSTNGEAITDWVTFDTAFDIVPRLVFNQILAEPEAGRMLVGWEDHLTPPAEFVAVQLQRETKDLEDWENPEPPVTFDVVSDPAATFAYYHFPRSRIEYFIRARLVKIVGGEQVASRWTTVVMSVDYWPYSFLKDVDEPLIYFAAYDTEATNRAAIEETAPTATALPWGADAYSHDVSLARLRSGAVSAEFYDDPQFIQSAEERYEVTRRLVGRRRPICIMDQVPDPEKVFAMVDSTSARNWRPGGSNDGLKAISFPWQETRYSEDWFKRNGLTP